MNDKEDDSWMFEPMNWDFMNEGSSHVVFKGNNRAQGWVLKLEKCEFEETEEQSLVYRACDASLSRLIRQSQAFKSFLPKHVFLCNIECCEIDQQLKKASKGFTDEMNKKYRKLSCHPSQRIKTDFNPHANPVIEEDLFYLTPKRKSDQSSRIVVEIKMKGMATFFPDEPSERFIQTFLGHFEEREKMHILEVIGNARAKIQSSECNIYFLRDVSKICGQKKTEPIRLFDGDSFYKNEKDGRKNFIRKQLTEQHSYLRYFDGQGQLIEFGKMDKVLGNLLGKQWREDFSTLIAECLDDRLIRLVAKLQTLTGPCMGEHLLRLSELNYPSIRDSKGISFLLKSFGLIVEIVLAEIDLAASIAEFNAQFDIVSKIKKKIIGKSSGLAQGLEPSEETNCENTWKDGMKEIHEDELELLIFYTIVLLIITFSDCTNLLDLRMVDSRAEKPEKDQFFLEKQVKLTEGTLWVQYRNTLVDFGLKKDDNLQGKFKAMKNLGCYAQFINSKYIS
jgi:hypothetical protein